MNDYLDDQTKARIKEALKQTQAQTEEAATQLGGLLRAGADKLHRAADRVKEAIRRDIDSRP
jgi:hypothetical protein